MPHTSGVRRTFGSLFLAVVALLAVGGVVFAYGLTSLYGASPNGDASTDVRIWLTSVLPLLLLVGWFCWLGLLGVVPSRRPGRRGALTGAVVLVTAVSCAAATALGQRSLEARCVEDGASLSAACPGFTGPPEEVCEGGVCRPVGQTGLLSPIGRP